MKLRVWGYMGRSLLGGIRKFEVVLLRWNFESIVVHVVRLSNAPLVKT